MTGAAWSGLTAFVLPERHTAILDAQLGKLLRRASKGNMSWTREDGSVRCNTTDKVFNCWKIEKSADALRIRRLKWYQQWARFPTDHGAVLAAVFGTTRGEQELGISASSVPQVLDLELGRMV